MQKGLAPIIIVILIAVALGGYLLYKQQPKPTLSSPQTTYSTSSPTTDETANWKTYTNSIYQFSFDYPQDWSFNTPSLEDKHSNNKSVLQINISSDSDIKNKILLENQKDILSMTVVIWDNRSKTLDQGIAEWDKFFQNPSPTSTSTKSVNQITWITRELTNISNIPIKQYITKKGNYLYILTASPQDSTFINLADQILSTFKFIQ